MISDIFIGTRRLPATLKFLLPKHWAILILKCFPTVSYTHLDVYKRQSKEWDGGYVICGMTGSGESFAVRDPWGIRPAFWIISGQSGKLAGYLI